MASSYKAPWFWLRATIYPNHTTYMYEPGLSAGTNHMFFVQSNLHSIIFLMMTALSSIIHYGLYLTHICCTLPNKSLLMLTNSMKHCLA